jgi:uroporphyrinogen III methyltransferase/synthase
MTLPLAGQTILITRAADASEGLAARLRELGATAIEAPTIEVGPPADLQAVDGAIARLSDFDWLVLTSTNGVRFFHERLAGRALPSALRIAAVGPKTAEACRALGWEPALVPARTHGEGLAEALAGEASGKRFLLARGDLASGELPEGLRVAGAVVEEIVVYTNRPCAQGEGAIAALEAGEVDWALFASGSAFRNLVAVMHDPASLKHVKLASIGPKTSQVIQEAGFEVAVEAAESTLEGLVAAIALESIDHRS